MENTFTKSTLYFLFFVTLIIMGYVVGLITFPTIKPIVAIKQSTITIEDAEIVDSQNAQTLPPLQTKEINPFNNNQVINIPSPRSQNSGNQENNLKNIAKDPRVTIIPTTDTDLNNPMGYSSYSHYNGDKVEIEISGEQPISSINSKNMIDDLSLMKPEKTVTKIQKNTIQDPYTPRIPLLHAPQEGYYEKTNMGLLPKTPANKKPLWQVYGNQTQIDMSKKPIAFILGGLGTDYDLTVKAIKTLPPQVTLGFIPYIKDLQKLMTMAREYGHETILEIPMETHGFDRVDTGLLTLKTTDTSREYKQKLHSLLATTTGYSGVMNYLGSKYVLDNKTSLNLLNDLKQYGLYFVENKTLRSGVLSELAQSNNIPYGASSDIIDEVLSPSNVNNNLNIIEKNTLIGKPAIATAYLSNLSLSLLATRFMMYRQNPNNDIQLIPISRYIENNEK